MRVNRISFEKTLCFADRHEVHLHPDVNLFIGPNGCGKSAVLDIISMLIKRLSPTWHWEEFGAADGRLGRRIAPIIDQETPDVLLPITHGHMGSRCFDLSVQCDTQDIDEIRRLCDRKDLLIAAADERGSDSLSSILKRLRPIDRPFVHDYRVLSDGSSEPVLPNSDDAVFRDYLRMVDGLSILYQSMGERSPRRPYLLFPSSRRVDVFEDTVVLSQREDMESRDQALVKMRMREPGTSYYRIALARLGSLYLDHLHRGHPHDFAASDTWRLLVSNLDHLRLTPIWQVVNRNTNEYRLGLTRHGVPVAYPSLSLGERQLVHFIVCLSCVGCENGTIIIDEPELNLHPRWQDLVYRIIGNTRETQNTQAIIATHSSRFINIASFSKTFRIFKSSDRVTISRGDAAQTGIAKNKLARMITATNAERLFFADRVLFVEGATDLIVFAALTRLKTADANARSTVEIIPVEGKSQIVPYLTLARHFGIPAAAVVDFDYLHDDPTLRDLLVHNHNSACAEIRKARSRDVQHLFRTIEEAIATHDLASLASSYERLRLKHASIDQTCEGASKRIAAARERHRQQGIHVLLRGDIEQYLPEGLGKNDLDAVDELFSDSERIGRDDLQHLRAEWDDIWTLILDAH